jgi:hypothetical protein
VVLYVETCTYFLGHELFVKGSVYFIGNGKK